jgi:inosine-uridine nucleoside N-ribohydrolase
MRIDPLRITPLVAVLTGLALGSGCSGEREARSRFIVDTDMNFDDAMAILYLLGRADVEVAAITVTGTGLASLDGGTQNSLRLLELAGNAGIPVAAGLSDPLAGTHPDDLPSEWRVDADTMMGLVLPTTSGQAGASAVDLLISTIQESPEPITVLTLGPLTNLARALGQEPALAGNVKRVYIMGGAVDVAGNVQFGGVVQNTVAEWNMYLDPVAAAAVFASGMPITLVGLDATDQAPITSAFHQRVREDRGTPAAELVHAGLTVLSDRAAIDDWYYFWDPLAAVLATEPALAATEPRRLVVVTEEGTTSGQTRVDSSGSAVDVAVTPDVAAFETAFVDGLNGRSRTSAD